MTKRLCLTQIATAHGVKGLVKLHVFVEDTSLLNGALFTSETGPETLSVTLKNATAKHFLAEIEGIKDRDAALALRGTKLYLDREALPEPEEGEFYVSDLIGLDVIDEADEKIGKVIDVANFGAGDMLEIRPLSGPSFYLPFTDENVPEIGEDYVRVHIPEGLVE